VEAVSGGSYNYLCFNTDELSTRRGDVSSMAERLERSGYFAAARATRNVLLLLDAAERSAKALEDVWHAVEWADSGDAAEDKVRKMVAEFSPWPPEVPEP
jgi:hypothetical protein